MRDLFLKLSLIRSVKFWLGSLLALICLVAVSCSSDEEDGAPQLEEIPPTLITTDPTEIGRTNAALNGAITGGTGHTIVEKGFIFLGSVHHEDSTVITVPYNTSEDIRYLIEELEGNTTYRYRSFATIYPRSNTQNRIHLLGNVVQFTTAKAAFAANSLIPGTGKPDDIIYISGSDFGNEEAEVKLGTIEVEIVSRTQNSIEFRVPEALEKRITDVSVTIGGTTVVVPVPFVFKGGSWEELPDAPVAGAVSFNFTIGDEVFIGYSTGGTFYSYKPDTGEWTEKDDAPLNVMCAFSLFDHQGYVITNENKVFIYSPVGGWLQLNDFPGEARQSAFAFTVNDKAYAGAGRTDVASLNDFWEYVPGEDSWTRKNDFPGTSNADAFGIGADGKAYVFARPEFWIYTPASDGWVQKQTFPINHANPRGFVINNEFFVSGINIEKVAYVYESTAEQWIRVGDLPQYAYRQPFAFSFDGKGYLGCGKGDQESKKVWAFTP